MKKLEQTGIRDILGLTPMQEGMLFHYLKEPQSDSYFIQLSLEVSEEIDMECFEKAWNFVATTNEMLRTVFRWEKLDKPTQIVLKTHHVNLVYHDLAFVREETEKNKQLEQIKWENRNKKFDLREVPLRVLLCKMASDRYHIVISNHHILFDGWSTAIILKEFLQAYETLKKGGQLLTPPSKPIFKEFIKWLQKHDHAKQIKFWEDYLEGVDTQTVLPIKQMRQTHGSTAGENYQLVLNPDIKNKFEAFAKEKRVTMAVLFYCAWGILLQKYCNIPDVVFGIILSGRSVSIKGIEDMVGLFINTLPLRVKGASGEKVMDLLHKVNHILASIEKYQYTSLVDINQCTRGGESSRELFDSIVTLENYPLDNLIEHETHLSIDSFSMEEMPHYDLTLVISLPDGIVTNFIFNKDLFDKEIVIRLAHHFQNILESIERDAEREVHDMEMLSMDEKKQLLVDFNHADEKAGYLYDKCIHQLFEEQVERTPYHTALVAQGAERKAQSREGRHAPCTMRYAITYKELNKKSNQLAYTLKEKGILADSIVGIMVERSIEMIVGILGILKAGNAYLPIDPDYPEDRIYYILSDSHAKILLTSHEITILSSPQAFNNCPGGTSSHLHLSPAPVTSLAYIIYTSGSTGKPKGVMVNNASVVNLLLALHSRYPLKKHDSYLLKTSYLFDVSVTELFGWFLEGGRLALLEEGEEKDPGKIVDTIERAGVTHINFVPSMFHTFVEILNPWDIAKLSSLKYIFLAGEALLPTSVNRFRRLNTVIYLENIYGPTEATVYASWYSLNDWKADGSIPIGKPLPDVALYIVNKWGYLQPIEVPGELCIGGHGLARGYLNQPGLTAERFKRAVISHSSLVISSPSKLSSNDQCLMTNDRFYKTGDLAKWLPDGNIEFLGRMDFQVKVRGFRIELGEIENWLKKHPGVKEAVVVAHKDTEGEVRLCTYVVGQAARDELHKYLSGVLPGYMVPAYFEKIETIPLTSSGKVNRSALPAPTIKSRKKYTAPRNEIEEALVNNWAEVLKVDKQKIGIDDNFFHLGGHSLKTNLLVSRIHKKLDVNIPLVEIFRTPTIRSLSGYIKNRAQDLYASIEPVEKKEYYELSSVQKRLYVIGQMDINSTAYNISTALLLKGSPDKDKLQDIFRKMIRRHESLRTSFVMIDVEPVQRIDDETVIGHWSLVIGEADGKEIDNTINSFAKPFDLSRAPLLRIGLIKMAAQKHILMVDMHHIISDGMSLGILEREFMELYAGKKPPTLRLQYKDYSEWHNRQTLEKPIKQQEAYWLKEFSEDIPVLDLPTDYPRPPVQDFAGSSIHFEMDGEETNALKSLANEQAVTLFMLVLSLYTVCLSRISGQEEIAVGTPIAGRRHADLESLMGMFVNTLVLRHFPLGLKPFTHFLQEVKESTIKAFENQDYLYEDLVEKVDMERDTSRNPLFDTMFTLQNFAALKIEIPGLKVQPIDYETRISKFDLALTAVEKDENLLFIFEYCTKLFKQETIRRFIRYFTKTISTVIDRHGIRISEIEIIGEEEKNRILHEYNDTAADYPGDKTIHRLFEEQVKQTPDNIAVLGPLQMKYRTYMTYISYRELNEKSDGLAYTLIEKGIQPDNIVGIMVERSIEMVIGIMGILKASAAYLPIATDYPQERIDFILKDSEAKILDTTGNLAKEGEKLKGWEGKKNFEIIFLDSLSSPSLLTHDLPHFLTSHCLSHPFNLAYVIYTSGTTGRPKGVMVEHSSVVNLIFSRLRRFNIDENDRILQFSSICFDASVEQIFIALSSGAVLVLIDNSTLLDSNHFKTYISRQSITHINVVPSFLMQMRLESSYSFKRLVSGGEICPLELAKKWSRYYNFYNAYGPTETTVTALDLSVNQVAESPGILPIGKPIINTEVYLLDKCMNLMPIGSVGEIHIGGAGVARGYLNKPELTAKKFCPRPPLIGRDCQSPTRKNFLLDQSKFYKTGDLARWLPDGNIEFLGRIDHQVKIRGYRIELGEIENCLLKVSGVKESVVLAREEAGGNKYICAYVVSDKEYGISELREYLSMELPDYMIPTYFVQVEKIPITPNGKIDRKALPAPEINAGEDYAAPRNKVEEKLAEIWAGVLGIEKEKISVNGNFFELGGHSLKAIILVSKIYRYLDVKLPLTELFKRATIERISQYIKGVTKTKYTQLNRVEETEYYDLSSAHKRFYVLQKMDITNTSFNFSIIKILEGEPDKKRFEEAYLKLLERHESLRTSFEEIEGKPVQKIQHGVDAKIEYYSPGFKVEEREISQSITRIIENFIRPFDLAHAPFMRIGLIKEENKKYILMIDVHHIIVDGLGLQILVKDFLKLYGGEELPLLRIQYKDFSEWQNRHKEKTSMRSQEDYWLKIFGGNIPVLNLPIDYVRPEVQSFAGDFVEFEIGPEETKFLKSLAEEEKTTLYILLLAISNIWLSKICNQEAVVIGTGAACRRHPDIQHMLGNFQNILALLNYPGVEKTFMEFLREVKERTVDAFENQEYPFEELVKKITLKREQGRNPLFDVFFLLQDTKVQAGGIREVEIDDLNVRPYIYQTRKTRFDLSLYGDDRGESVYFTLEYCSRLFKNDTIKQFVGYFKDIIYAVKENKNPRLKDIKISHNLFAGKDIFAPDDYMDFSF